MFGALHSLACVVTLPPHPLTTSRQKPVKWTFGRELFSPSRTFPPTFGETDGPLARVMTPRRGRGRPRKDGTALLAPSTLRTRKFRAKRALVDLARSSRASLFCDSPLPAALMPFAPRRIGGRPPKPSHLLTARGAETRRYRARKSCRVLLLSLAAEVVDDVAVGRGNLAEATMAEALAEECADAQRIEAERRAHVRAARQLALLREHLPEGTRGLLEATRTISHEVKSGMCCGLCTEETTTIVPCCGLATNPAADPKWYCAACVAQMKLVYARDPSTSNQGRQYVSGHLGERCPYCRRDGQYLVVARKPLCMLCNRIIPSTIISLSMIADARARARAGGAGVRRETTPAEVNRSVTWAHAVVSCDSTLRTGTIFDIKRLLNNGHSDKRRLNEIDYTRCLASHVARANEMRRPPLRARPCVGRDARSGA